MSDLGSRIALVTGGASGIGLAMAHRFAREGMRIALADVEAAALENAASELRDGGAEVVGVATDVGDAAQMDRLAARVRDELGPVHLACLNAGVSGGGGPMETLSSEDWAWAIHVNLWGVIHGLRVFLDDMKQRDEGHVVITASMAAHTCFPSAGPYHATKHAVAAIAETLFRELREEGSQVGVTCVCPGLVGTNFPFGDRNRPEALRNPPDPSVSAEQVAHLQKAVKEIFDRGATAEDVAERVLQAVRERRFYVYTDDVHADLVRRRHRAIEQGGDPPTDVGALDAY